MKQKKAIAIGVIGAAGAIGQMHAHYIKSSIEGAYISAMYDINTKKTEELAAQYHAVACASADELIAAPFVDAILIASWDATHAEYTSQCIAAGKPVFCEKPLATTLADCEKIVQADQDKNLVQLGFMRRFDPDYIKMKQILQSGELGAPLMAHCISRTPRISAAHTTPMHISNIVIHEIDVFRWLLEEEIDTVQVHFPRSTAFASKELRDPQFILMQSQSGVLIDVEAAANSYYGYEIRCELVCEKGTISLPVPAEVEVRSRLMHATAIPDSWENRFTVAYRAELQHWVDAMGGKQAGTAPNSMDGYAACAVCEALIRAQTSGGWETVDLRR